MLKIKTEKADNFLAYFSSFPIGSTLFIQVKRNQPPTMGFDTPDEKRYTTGELVLHYQGVSVHYNLKKEEEGQTDIDKLIDKVIAKANENKISIINVADEDTIYV